MDPDDEFLAEVILDQENDHAELAAFAEQFHSMVQKHGLGVVLQHLRSEDDEKLYWYFHGC